jgi:hypothetical protein
MKKQKEKKAKTKKEDKLEPSAEPSKAEEEPETTPEKAPPSYDETEDPEPGDTKDAQETVSELNTVSHGRQPSLSLQSKMRSSSFRQSSGGPLSPGYGFSPDGETAPDIFRKQALKIEELEKENKRLTKEASDGEKRWKKAEEELEDLREAEDDSSKTKAASSTSRSSGELEKLAYISFHPCPYLPTDSRYRDLNLPLSSARIPNFKPRRHEPQGMDLHPQYQ